MTMWRIFFSVLFSLYLSVWPAITSLFNIFLCHHSSYGSALVSIDCNKNEIQQNLKKKTFDYIIWMKKNIHVLRCVYFFRLRVIQIYQKHSSSQSKQFILFVNAIKRKQTIIAADKPLIHCLCVGVFDLLTRTNLLLHTLTLFLLPRRLADTVNRIAADKQIKIIWRNGKHNRKNPELASKKNDVGPNS